MCATCGCGRLEAPRPAGSGSLAGLSFEPVAPPPPPDPHEARRIEVEHAVLAKNDRQAARNREWFGQRRITAINLLSAPGSGKTSLLERSIRERGAALAIRVIEGDQAGEFDADRIRAAGAPVVQVNTGTGCHLDADMVERALGSLEVPAGGVLMIENVGNLVCPALFDLGEAHRVVVASVTEGEDKPLKYPHMFRNSNVVLLNKVDLLPHLDFDVAAFRAALAQVNPDAEVLEVSARTGAGMERWYARLEAWAGPEASVRAEPAHA